MNFNQLQSVKTAGTYRQPGGRGKQRFNQCAAEEGRQKEISHFVSCLVAAMLSTVFDSNMWPKGSSPRAGALLTYIPHTSLLVTSFARPLPQ